MKLRDWHCIAIVMVGYLIMVLRMGLSLGGASPAGFLVAVPVGGATIIGGMFLADFVPWDRY